MAEASDSLSNKQKRLSKRRKLNIDNAMQEDMELAPMDTPKSQRVGNHNGDTRSPVVIDVTGCDDTPMAIPVPETPRCGETSGDDVTICLTADHEISRKAAFVQIPRPCLTEAVFLGWQAPDTLWAELDVLTQHSSSDEVQHFDLHDFTVY
jgi:hypothetical protein